MTLSGNLWNTDTYLCVSLSFLSNICQKSIFQISSYIPDLKPALRTVECNWLSNSTPHRKYSLLAEHPWDQGAVREQDTWSSTLQKIGQVASLTLVYTGISFPNFQFPLNTVENSTLFQLRTDFMQNHQDSDTCHTCGISPDIYFPYSTKGVLICELIHYFKCKEM